MMSSPYVSPMFCDPVGPPPITMLTGTHDVLCPDILKFDEKLDRLGGENLSINFINSKAAPVPDIPDDPGIPPKTPDEPTSPETPDTPPAQEEVSEVPVLPKTPDTPAPAVDISVHTLPQTGTGFWLSSMLLRFGTALLACGWFLTRRQRTAG